MLKKRPKNSNKSVANWIANLSGVSFLVKCLRNWWTTYFNLYLCLLHTKIFNNNLQSKAGLLIATDWRSNNVKRKTMVQYVDDFS